jgi:hypothetical protein
MFAFCTRGQSTNHTTTSFPLLIYRTISGTIRPSILLTIAIDTLVVMVACSTPVHSTNHTTTIDAPITFARTMGVQTAFAFRGRGIAYPTATLVVFLALSRDGQIINQTFPGAPADGFVGRTIGALKTFAFPEITFPTATLVVLFAIGVVRQYHTFP